MTEPILPAGDGSFIAIVPCAICGSSRLMIDDSPYCADCGDDE